MELHLHQGTHSRDDCCDVISDVNFSYIDGNFTRGMRVYLKRQPEAIFSTKHGINEYKLFV